MRLIHALQRALLFLGFVAPALQTMGWDSALAQSYPRRPVRVVVPFAAGGTFDLVGRVVAGKLTEMWGQQVVVDNRPGGGTIIATEIVAKSNSDGYTIFLSPNALAANPALHKRLPYDTSRDLKPVVLIAAQPMALGAHPSFKANSIAELIEMAKAQPKKLSYGAAGVGSGGHLAGEIFKSMAGKLDVVFVSYKGGNIAMMDVMANQIPLVMTGLPNLLPHWKAGRIKILAITDSQRSPVAQEIPTISETVAGYEFRNWFGFVVPTGTPRQLIQRVNNDVNRVLGMKDVRERLLGVGFIVIGGTVEEFLRVIKTDTAKFGKVIREAQIRVN
ncbi:MAG: tripartite tricarboxylate transporter substrate binding protein [Betaproteobacteria bacterium]|nr:tripartite tricarboxylate transporter substrate binding protein [Betaproteobacteria bacterium]